MERQTNSAERQALREKKIKTKWKKIKTLEAVKPCPYCPHKATQAEVKFENIPKHLMSLTLGELAAKFGNLESLQQYVKMLKDLIDVDERDQALRDRKAAEALKSAQSAG
jgi:hypothetical protein